MNRLKIRAKMLLLYMIFSVVLLSILLPLVYRTVSASLYQSLESDIQLTVSQMMATSKMQHGEFTTKISPEEMRGLSACVLAGKNKVLFTTQNGNWLQNIEKEDRQVLHNGEIFLVIQEKYEMDNHKLTVVAGSSIASMQKSLEHLRLLLLALIPVYLGFSGLCAFFITKRALRPIAKITETAKTIGSGDLSQRIKQLPVKDEVGELIDAFNAMLDKVEHSFQRERQFSSDASHELRTPVAVISACTEDALTEPQSAETRRNLESIRKETNRMNHIISQLLLLTRGYEGRYRVEKEEISLSEMVESVMEELEEQAAKAGIHLENQVEETVSLVADQSLMTQLLVNILTNGIKYGRPGGVVQVYGDQEGNQVTLRIKDDGIGIGPEDLPHIFKRFYRADKARDRSGSGLGLSIVQWIIEIHQGDITAESEIGGGTVFTIKLPKNKTAE